MLVVEGFECRYIALIGGTVGPEVLGNGAPGGLLVLFCRKGVIAELLIEGDPAVRVFQREGVRRGYIDGAGARPTQ